MAKMVYLISGMEKVSSIREVCDILGEKVTKKDITDGAVDAVQYLLEEDADAIINGDSEEVAEDVEDDSDLLASIPAEDEVETGATESVEEDSEEVDEEESTDENTEEDSEEDNTDGLDEEPEDEELARAKRGDDIKPDANQDKYKVPSTLAEKLAMITKPKEEKAKSTAKLDPNQPVDYPEKGTFADEKELKKFYKKLSDAHLDEWLDIEGLTYKPCDNPGINRMRKCMAIKEFHFPNENKGTKKSKSRYADISTEMLVEMCLDNDIQLKDSKGDMRILRMYAIMALREQGFLE